MNEKMQQSINLPFESVAVVKYTSIKNNITNVLFMILFKFDFVNRKRSGSHWHSAELNRVS